jgi:hypothetical protein
MTIIERLEILADGITNSLQLDSRAQALWRALIRLGTKFRKA